MNNPIVRNGVPWLVLIGLMMLVRMLSDAGAVEQQDQFDLFGEPFRTSPPGLIGSVTGLGFLLLGAWLTGRLFQSLKLAKVSGYLLFGVLVGPSLASMLPDAIPALVPEQQLTYLQLINSLAISIIALTAGGEIRVDFLRKGLARIGTITCVEIVFVLVGVSGALLLAGPLLFDFVADASRTSTIVIAILIATLAIANSPAVVIAMLGETRAEGPMAQMALTVTILKDLALIILFTIIVAISARMLAIESTGTAVEDAAEGVHLLQYLAWHLLGSMVIGVIIGAVMSFVAQRIGDQTAIFVLCCALGIALVSEAADLEPLLVSLMAGFIMANLWPRQSRQFFHEMEQLALPVFCVFFAVAGAKVDVNAVLQYWPLALFIVAVRCFMIWSGTTLGSLMTGMPPPARTWLWTALIPQAGVTVALIASLERSFADFHWMVALSSLLLTVVAIHELVGPSLMRLGLVRSGEVEGEGPNKSD